MIRRTVLCCTDIAGTSSAGSRLGKLGESASVLGTAALADGQAASMAADDAGSRGAVVRIASGSAEHGSTRRPYRFAKLLANATAWLEPSRRRDRLHPRLLPWLEAP